jgi:hypothetical protein
MGHIWVREFTGGLDTRRMPETTPGGVLIQATNGHITRGGEFEKRASFVDEYTLPAGTVGLAYTRTGIVVFGHAAEPVLPSGVSYQRLQHPDGTTVLLSVPSWDLYRGKIYAVGVFADGSRHHFYDGARVEDWFDGRARASFRVTAGGVNLALPGSATFEVTGGTVGGGNQITSITVNSVTVTSGAELFDTDNDTTAAAIAANINAHTSSPEYVAESSGAFVTITSVATGTAVNGFVVAITVGGDVTVDDASIVLANATDETVSTLTGITVNGVDIIFSAVEWTTDNATTATAIADLIDATSTSPEYTAFSNGDQVVIEAVTQGESENGNVVIVSVADGFGVTPTTGIAMAGGAEVEDTFDPGTFVRTIGSKVYSASGPNMHFSGVQLPTGWTTDNVGAGFVDMSSHSSGSEELTALAQYQNNVAVFAETVIQIWYVDPDPTLNRRSQTLNNTGTFSPRSVTQFGDNDIFYLNESGLRSLRARDSSNSASTTDIGIPVDSLIVDAISTLSNDERERIVGLIEPRDGRFWLIIAGEIYVFSFFSGAKVSAWSKYLTTDSAGEEFTVTDAVVFGRRVHLRADDTIYVYGGLGDTIEYDETEAVAQIPYLDGDKPWQEKQLSGFDAAGIGAWRVYAAMNPNNLEAQDVVAEFADVIADTTFGEARLPLQGSTNHISLIFKSQNDGYAKLGSCVIHFNWDEKAT